MFAKLLKHEWRASWGTLGILTLALLGVGVLAAIDLRIVINWIDSNSMENNPFLNLVMVGMMVFLGACALCLCVYGIGVQIVLLYRFYKNKFTDEGYLTFTLPVSTQDIFWSSFVNMLIWLLISFVAIILVVLIVALFGTATDSLINLGALEVLKEIFTIFIDLPWQELFGSGKAVVLGVLYVLTLLAAPIYGIMIPMGCITGGAVLAKKHKVLAAFGVYYLINAVTGILGSVVAIAPTILIGVTSQDVADLYIASMASSLVLTVGLTVVGYFVTIHLMHKKLNLP